MLSGGWVGSGFCVKVDSMLLLDERSSAGAGFAELLVLLPERVTESELLAPAVDVLDAGSIESDIVAVDVVVVGWVDSDESTVAINDGFAVTVTVLLSAIAIAAAGRRTPSGATFRLRLWLCMML